MFKHKGTDSISIPLSPYSSYASETDPFLSSGLSPSPYLTPNSPRNSTSSFHSVSSASPRLGALPSPTSSGFFEHIAIPPTAKRARSRTLVAAAGGLLLFTAMVGLTHHRLELTSQGSYVERVSNGLALVKGWSGGWSGSWRDDGLAEDVSFEVEGIDKDDDLPDQIPVTTLPTPRLPDADDADVHYLGFLPHSGYHNQRSGLQNALMLGKLLNRTVLLPPVWIGWPVPTQYYTDLRKSWLDIMLLNPSSFNITTLTSSSPLNEPGTFASSTSFPCSNCDADDAELLAHREAFNKAKKEKYVEMGYVVREDGYPIVPGLDASSCKSYSAECRFTYQDTFLAWDFLVDIDRATEVGVNVVDRWDMREKAVEGLLGIGPEEVYVVEDRQAYDFQFTDRVDSSLPLISNHTTGGHWNRDVSIPALRARDEKVLLFGSMFGSSRVLPARMDDAEAKKWAESFGRAMAFKNEYLLRPARAIVARMGGQKNFVGVHARVGDGGFLAAARRNSEHSWKRLAREKLGVRPEVVEEMWERVRPEHAARAEDAEAVRSRSRSRSRSHRRTERRSTALLPPSHLVERSPWAPVDGEYDVDSAAELSTPSLPVSSSTLSKRRLFDWFAPPEPSSFLRNLTCRSPLHTSPSLKAFNTPVYLATDSRSPETDANLRPFFDAFPCTFFLSDFDRPDEARNDGLVVQSVHAMGRLVNELDGVSLGRLFLPFLEAIVAAMAREVVGTQGSTFSGFAEAHLHRAYWNDD